MATSAKKFTIRVLRVCASILITSVAFKAMAGSPAVPTFGGDVKMKLAYKNEEVWSMVEAFAKASQKTFVVDPIVRGKISVFAPEPLGLDEAFDLLSTALALNGYAIVEHPTKFVVMAARNASRSGIPLYTELPPLKPERYLTWIVTLKNLPVEVVNNNLRVLPSKDGEMTPIRETNQLMITDFASNVVRIAGLIKELDQPVAPAIAKLVQQGDVKHQAVSKERIKSAEASGEAPKPKFKQ